MNTRQIEYILAIAEDRNMQRAANRLYVSQSSLSQTLLKLESELGCQLFSRTSRELVPTQEGTIYIEAAKQILNIKEKAYQRIKASAESRQLHYEIGVSSHGAIKKLLRASVALQAKWPGAEIYALEDSYKNLLLKLREKILKIIIVSWNVPQEIPFPHKILHEEEILLVAPKGMIKSDSNTVPWTILKDRKLILTPKGTSLRNMTDSIFSNLGFTPQTICELSNVSATIDVVEQKQALAFLPKDMCRDEDSLEYFHLLPQFTRYQIVVYDPEAAQDEILQDFLQLLEHEKENIPD